MNLKQSGEEYGIKVYKTIGKLHIIRNKFCKIEKWKCELNMLRKEVFSKVYGKSIEEIEMPFRGTSGEPRRNRI